jgi:hypothetical protein
MRKGEGDMFPSYQTYQIERPKSQAEQREIDRSNAELVAAIGAAVHRLTAPWRSSPGPRHHSRPVRIAASVPDEMAECCTAVR